MKKFLLIVIGIFFFTTNLLWSEECCSVDIGFEELSLESIKKKLIADKNKESPRNYVNVANFKFDGDLVQVFMDKFFTKGKGSFKDEKFKTFSYRYIFMKDASLYDITHKELEKYPKYITLSKTSGSTNFLDMKNIPKSMQPSLDVSYNGFENVRLESENITEWTLYIKGYGKKNGKNTENIFYNVYVWSDSNSQLVNVMQAEVSPGISKDKIVFDGVCKKPETKPKIIPDMYYTDSCKEWLRIIDISLSDKNFEWVKIHQKLEKKFLNYLVAK